MLPATYSGTKIQYEVINKDFTFVILSSSLTKEGTPCYLWSLVLINQSQMVSVCLPTGETEPRIEPTRVSLNKTCGY